MLVAYELKFTDIRQTYSITASMSIIDECVEEATEKVNVWRFVLELCKSGICISSYRRISRYAIKAYVISLIYKPFPNWR